MGDELNIAEKVIKDMSKKGIQMYIGYDNNEAKIIARPKNLLEDKDRKRIVQYKFQILALLIQRDLRRLLQVIDMADDINIPVGLQEDWASAIVQARRSVGKVWDEPFGFYEH